MSSRSTIHSFCQWCGNDVEWRTKRHRMIEICGWWWSGPTAPFFWSEAMNECRAAIGEWFVHFVCIRASFEKDRPVHSDEMGSNGWTIHVTEIVARGDSRDGYIEVNFEADCTMVRLYWSVAHINVGNRRRFSWQNQIQGWTWYVYSTFDHLMKSVFRTTLQEQRLRGSLWCLRYLASCYRGEIEVSGNDDWLIRVTALGYILTVGSNPFKLHWR